MKDIERLLSEIPLEKPQESLDRKIENSIFDNTLPAQLWYCRQIPLWQAAVLCLSVALAVFGVSRTAPPLVERQIERVYVIQKGPGVRGNMLESTVYENYKAPQKNSRRIQWKGTISELLASDEPGKSI